MKDTVRQENREGRDPVAGRMHPIWKATEKSRVETELREAIRLLSAGGVIAYPTETYYGLGCLPSSPASLERIYALKRRPHDKPLPLIASDLSAARRCARNWTEAAERLAVRFWPGPLTLIVPAVPELPEALSAGSGKVAVRVSSHWVARTLAARIGGLIVSTSANMSGGRSCRRISSLPQSLLMGLDGVVDEGATPGGKASTLVDVSKDYPEGFKIIRRGAVSEELLAEVLRRA